MRDMVGSKVPTSDDVAKLVADVRGLTDQVGSYTITLSAEERGSTVKMRTGGENIVAMIGELARAHGITLPQVSVDGMNADLALAQRIRPLANAVAQLNQRLEDTVLEAQSECWWAATALYTALSRVAGADATLESELRPVVEFFGRRRRSASGTPVTPTSPTEKNG